VRRAFVPRFPYGVFYTLDDGVPTVIAVIHLHRDPAEWQRRM
jgi:toxin ParE1/3/4